MKLSVVVALAVFAAMSVSALPQRRDDADLAAVDDSVLQGPVAPGGVPECPPNYDSRTGDIAVDDDLLSGGNPDGKPKLICLTNKQTSKGYEWCWKTNEGSGSCQKCKLVPSKSKPDCRSGSCGGPGSAGPEVGPVSPISPETLDTLDGARDGDLLEGGVPAKNLVCETKGWYSSCNKDGSWTKVIYEADEKNGTVIKSIQTLPNYKGCKKSTKPGSALPF